MALPLLLYVCMPVLLLLAVIMACFEFYVWTGIAYVGSIVLAYFIASDIPAVQALVATYGIVKMSLIFIPVYLAIGVAVAFVKWSIFMQEFGAWITSKKIDYDNLTDDKKTALLHSYQKNYTPLQQFANHLINSSTMRRFNLKASNFAGDSTNINLSNLNTTEDLVSAIAPTATSHLDRLSFWITEWPFVLLALLFKNFVLKLVENIVNLFGGTFHKIGKYFIGKAVGKINL